MNKGKMIVYFLLMQLNANMVNIPCELTMNNKYLELKEY